MYRYELMIDIKSVIQSSDFYIKKQYNCCIMNYYCTVHSSRCVFCREEAMGIELQKERQPLELRIKVQQSYIKA